MSKMTTRPLLGTDAEQRAWNEGRNAGFSSPSRPTVKKAWAAADAAGYTGDPQGMREAFAGGWMDAAVQAWKHSRPPGTP